MRQSPIEFDLALCEEIADHIAQGKPMAEKLREIGARMDRHIDRRTINRWRKQHPEVGAMFDDAREAGFDEIAEDILAIADDGSRDYVPGERGVVVDHDHIQRSKLRAEMRLKLLAKWDPRRYGDRSAVELTGKDGKDLIPSTPPPGVDWLGFPVAQSSGG